MTQIEIYDATLREGEQAAGASFSFEDRIKIAQELDNFGIDYIELGWPLSSEDIFNSFRAAIGKMKNAKIVAFGSTSISNDIEEDKNLNSIVDSGARYACIVGKTDLEHVEKQLRITSEENLRRISESIKFLRKHNIIVFYDAEHYFDSFKKDKEYSIKTLKTALEAGAERIILCDTKGGIFPQEARIIVKKTINSIGNLKDKLGIHFHNDCGLALGNTLACLSFARQVQGTINGIGERIGNLNFTEFLPVYMKKMNNKLEKINLKKLKEINEEVFRMSGIDIPEIRAFVGETAFAHKGGIHTDAVSKGVSYEHEKPEDFGNKTSILLNTLGGKSCVISAAQEFGYQLDKKNPEVEAKIQELFEELSKLEKKGYRIGAIKAEKFLLIEKYFGKFDEFFSIEKWKIETGIENNKEKSSFHMSGKFNGKNFEEIIAIEGGPVDAAYKAIIKLLEKNYPQVSSLKLIDFHVSIAKSMKEESTVRTSVWFSNEEEFETVGVNENILASAIEALIKGLRYYLNLSLKTKNTIYKNGNN